MDGLAQSVRRSLRTQQSAVPNPPETKKFVEKTTSKKSGARTTLIPTHCTITHITQVSAQLAQDAQIVTPSTLTLPQAGLGPQDSVDQAQLSANLAPGNQFQQILDYQRFLRGRLYQYKWTKYKKTLQQSLKTSSIFSFLTSSSSIFGAKLLKRKNRNFFLQRPPKILGNR
uniref:Uncharacterized protein n=1 Tax=Romanomermis culicivorax TaxID=13658 RepID=A0A915KQQ7_ROMCU